MIKQLEYAESIIRSNPLNAYDIAIDEAFQKSDDRNVVKDALFIEIKGLWLMSRFEEAIERAKVLLEMAEFDGDVTNKGRANNVIGSVYYDLGNYDKALDYYRKSLNFAKQVQDKHIESAVLNNIGEIYLKLEAYKEAHDYYNQSMAIAKENGDEALYGFTQLNIGEAYYKQGILEDAFTNVSTALHAFTEKEDYVSLAYTHFILSKIRRKQKNIDQAKLDLKHAIDIMRRLQDQHNLNQAYIEMIDLLIQEEAYEEALEYIEDGLDIADRLNAPSEKSKIALYAAEIYEQLEEYKTSLEYHKIYVKARLSYEKARETELLNNINAQIAIDHAEHEKEIYKLKSVELKKKNDEIQKLYHDMKIINNIGQDITATLDIKKVLYLLYENLNKLMDATSFGIMLYDPEKRLLDGNLLLVYGKPSPIGLIELDDEGSLNAWVVRNKQAIFVNHFDDEEGIEEYGIKPRRVGNIKTKSIIVVPLLLMDDVIGTITVQSSAEGAYKDYHFNMIKALASYITIAILNSKESQKLSLEIEERIKTQNELEILNEKLSEMSYIDALTQIPNRRSFVDYFTRELSRAKRNGEALALLIIDIDFFKEYNDNYGHVEGDRCLHQVANLLKAALKREVDFVARYGGDEFVAVMSNIDEYGTYQIAQQMVLNVKEAALEHVHSPIEDIITITIGGITLVPKQEHTMEQVIHFADKALYVAKDKGRNQIGIYENED